MMPRLSHSSVVSRAEFWTYIYACQVFEQGYDAPTMRSTYSTRTTTLRT